MGAIIGALYAREPDAAGVRRRLLDLLNTGILRGSGIQLTEKLERIAKKKVIGPPVEHLFRLYAAYQSATREHIMQDEVLRSALSDLFEDQSIEDLRIPFASVAVDLQTAERIVLHRGSVRTAVLASSSIPGIFPPVRIQGRHLVDGAVLSLVPISAAYTLGADIVISVDVSPPLEPDPHLDSASQIVLRCEHITSRAFNALRLSESDIVLEPIRTDCSWADFGKADALMTAGYEGTLKRVADIRGVLRFPRYRWQILKRRFHGHHGWVNGPVPTTLAGTG